MDINTETQIVQEYANYYYNKIIAFEIPLRFIDYLDYRKTINR